MPKAKRVITLGPSSRTPEMLRKLILAGANVFRLNFSHGSYEEHGENIERIRAAEKEVGIPVAILQDLSGPKIRITKIEQEYAHIADDGLCELRPSDGSFSTAEIIYVETINPLEVLEHGQQVLLADGIIELVAVERKKTGVLCKVRKGGRLRSRVGIAFPESRVLLPATTEKDMRDLEWGIEHKVDYVAISFVMNAEDIRRVQRVIEERGGHQRTVAKIERRAAIDNLREILDFTDVVMVARGDLGLEYPLEQLPLLQKRIIEECNARGIPVIVATQMLSSMVTALRPTRAEVSDVANAIMGGADAVMLSEETTIGEHPLECVQYLGRVAEEAEKSFTFEEFKLRMRNADRATVPDAVAYAACAAAVKVNASAIIACTETGFSARLSAKYRPQQPLYAISPSMETLRRMQMYWGVTPIPCDAPTDREHEVDMALRIVQKAERLPNGTRAVVTGGISVRTPGSTSVLEIREFQSDVQ